MESTIELSVLKKEIHFVKKDSLTTGQQRNSIKISFNGKEWNGLTKYGVFKVEDTVKDVLITNSDIEIPAEVCTLDNLGKVVYFGIKGTYTETIDGTKTETVYTTPYFRLGVLERGTETSGNIPEYPTQNVIDAAIENARRWAVGPSSIDKVPTDTNNAKYWSGQAEKFANIFSKAGQLVIKDKYTTLEELRNANPNHAYTYQVEQPNGELYIYSDAAKDWVSIGVIQGYKGEKGDKGDKGEKGDIGLKGETGATGPQGIQGIQGEKGDTGPQGIQGEKGEIGPVGPQGATGPQGPQGEKGETGPAGPKGDTGPEGKQGPRGETGATGPQGADGAPGKDGAKGDKGDTGPRGPQGKQGIQGETGKGFRVLGYYNTKAALDAAQKETALAGDAYGVGTVAPYDIYIFDGVTNEFINNGPLQGAKGEQGIQGEKGDKGDKGDPGSYTAGTGIEITDGVISATAEVYKSGDGISIINGLISALLGTGLKFDADKKITLDETTFTEYTDDEITSIYNSVEIS